MLGCKFDCAQPLGDCLDGGVVFCGSIRNQRIQECAKSKPDELLQTLHSLFTHSATAKASPPAARKQSLCVIRQ